MGEGHRGKTKGGVATNCAFRKAFGAADCKCDGGSALFDGFKEIGGKSFACESFTCWVEINAVFFFLQELFESFFIFREDKVKIGDGGQTFNIFLYGLTKPAFPDFSGRDDLDPDHERCFFIIRPISFFSSRSWIAWRLSCDFFPFAMPSLTLTRPFFK